MMTVLRRLLVVALITGGASGLLLGIAQVAFITPLILEAEAHEHRDPNQHEAAHHAWEPKEGVERNAYTVLFTTLAALAFALILNAGMLLRNGTGVRQGLFWGSAGFVVFSLAPALGLPPELPGMQAADLVARQSWWTGTVLATATGLACITFSKRPWLRTLGVAVLIVPQVIAPSPGLVPANAALADLEHAFIATSLSIMLGFWLVVGAFSGFLHGRYLAHNSRAPSLAHTA